MIPRDVAGMQEQVVQTADRLIKLPEWGDLSEWVMCQHSGTALFSARQWGNPMGRRIAVLGQGGIGLTFTMIAERQGAGQIVGIDLEEYRCKTSSSLGATHTINASNDDVVQASEQITEGQMFDVVVDASGDPSGLATAVDLVKEQGQIISFSLVDPKLVTFDHRKWMAKNIQLNATVIAATQEPVQEIRDIVALKERGWIDPGVLKTHEMKFEDVQNAYDQYEQYEDEIINSVGNPFDPNLHEAIEYTENSDIDDNVIIDSDTTILPNTHITANSRIGSNCNIGPNTIIRESTIGKNCKITSTVVDKSLIHNNVSIGPFSHIREGCIIEDEVEIGRIEGFNDAEMFWWLVEDIMISSGLSSE